jgi:hypothetical protein
VLQEAVADWFHYVQEFSDQFFPGALPDWHAQIISLVLKPLAISDAF